MRRTLIPLAAAAVLGAAAPTSSASSADTFSGSCHFSGTVSFDPPLTTSAQPTHAVAEAAGPCSGTWTTANGKPLSLDGDQVLYRAYSDGTQSCASSSASGAGFIEYRHHRLYFSLSETRVGATSPLRLDGRAGGSFTGVASGSGDPVTIAQQCAGPGLAQAAVDISGSTTPTMSG
jgi:hypothetical protein